MPQRKPYPSESTFIFLKTVQKVSSHAPGVGFFWRNAGGFLGLEDAILKEIPLISQMKQQQNKYIHINFIARFIPKKKKSY